jgi:ferric-dicitrate binding protein FerR (iron transport regulator)
LAWAWDQIAECQKAQTDAADADCTAEARDPVGLGRTGRILGLLLVLAVGAVALTLFLHR